MSTDTEQNVGTQNTESHDETNLNVTENMESEEFEHSDDSMPPVEDMTSYKYTEIDCLNEDPPVRGQKFVLLSFISPEGIMNCKVRGLMVRGSYATYEEAQAAVEKLKKIDKYFDVFIGEVGKWLPWNPSTKQVEEVKYRNKNLNKIMKKIHESDTKSLNELVGRRKEMIDKEKVSHKNRIKTSIKESAKNLEPSKDEEEQQPTVKKSNRDPNAVRDRLRKALAEKEQAKVTQKMTSEKTKQSTTNVTESTLEQMKENINTENARLEAKNEKINKLQEASSAIDDKLKKMREMYEKRQ